MAYHTLVYHINQVGGTFTAYTPIPDPTVTINGVDIQVPDKYNELIRAVGTGFTSNGTYFELQSPSLRGLYFPDFGPVVSSVTVPGPDGVADYDAAPLQLVTNEGLAALGNGGGSTAADSYIVLFLADGSPQPAKGNFRTIRATTSITASATAWNNGPINFDQTLPVGTYDIVGLRVEAAGLAAARLIFIGSSAVTRPGVPCQSGPLDLGLKQFRFGNAGVLGTFPSTNPPNLEIVGGTSTSQAVFLDLIKR